MLPSCSIDNSRYEALPMLTFEMFYRCYDVMCSFVLIHYLKICIVKFFVTIIPSENLNYARFKYLYALMT